MHRIVVSNMFQSFSPLQVIYILNITKRLRCLDGENGLFQC